MSSHGHRKEIQVHVGEEALTAELTIPGGADPDTVSVRACLSQLSAAGLQVTKAMEQSVASLVDRFIEAPEQSVSLSFEGTPAVPGESGRFEWAPGCEPDGEPSEPTSDERVDFYEQCAFVTVQSGDPIGRIVPPTEGTEGLDLCGSPIPVRPGKPASIAADTQSISVEADGTCRSLLDGVIRTSGNKIWISPFLEVDGYVDFHTGNIKFQGDVSVRKGIRDRFIVSTSGDLFVQQLVEAAELDVGKDLKAAGGIAAKGRGRLRVARDLTARYLDSVIGSVGHDALIEREMIQSDLAVGGDLRILRGALIGGTTRVGGTAQLPELGSRAHLRTMLVLGTLPELDKLLVRLHQHIQNCRVELAKVEAEIERLVSASGSGPDDAERLGELMKTAPLLEQKITDANRRGELLRERYDKESRVELHVARTVHTGTIVQVGQQQLIFRESVNAPVRLARSADHRLLMAVGSGNLKPVKSTPGVRLIQNADAECAA